MYGYEAKTRSAEGPENCLREQTTAPHQAEIPAKLGSVGNKLSDLENILNGLAIRLVPVMRSASPSTDKDCREIKGASTEVGENLAQFALILDGMIRNVADIQNRLEL